MNECFPFCSSSLMSVSVARDCVRCFVICTFFPFFTLLSRLFSVFSTSFPRFGHEPIYFFRLIFESIVTNIQYSASPFLTLLLFSLDTRQANSVNVFAFIAIPFSKRSLRDHTTPPTPPYVALDFFHGYFVIRPCTTA